jgi:hypothetical protein
MSFMVVYVCFVLLYVVRLSCTVYVFHSKTILISSDVVWSKGLKLFRHICIEFTWWLPFQQLYCCTQTLNIPKKNAKQTLSCQLHNCYVAFKCIMSFPKWKWHKKWIQFCWGSGAPMILIFARPNP